LLGVLPFKKVAGLLPIYWYSPIVFKELPPCLLRDGFLEPIYLFS
jgi:hypothetical protein